jgi:hypothetical protein
MNTQAIKTADFYPRTTRASAAIYISVIENGNRSCVDIIEVRGKRHARQVAAEVGAKPWNF